MSETTPIWTPSSDRISHSWMAHLKKHLGESAGTGFSDYQELHRFSVEQPEAFWGHLWDAFEIRGKRNGPVLVDGDRMPGARFFPEARLNYAENMLRHRGEQTAMVFRGEDNVNRRLSRDALVALVSRLQQGLAAAGVKKGDRVAAMLPNMPETIAAMLATVSIGAIWSSCSPDFGVGGVMDRFGQIEPKIFLACDGYRYNGKWIDCTEKVAEISGKLGASQVVILPYSEGGSATAAAAENGTTLEKFLEPHSASEPTFTPVEFNHPLYILFSSGTTGVPKCIVHCHGGVLLQHLKEHRYHCDVSEGDRVFYFTTCGWMMWNWLASGLGLGATLMLYDGSPFHPDGNALFDFAEQEKINFLGTSAKFIDAVRKAGLRPRETHDLSSLRTIASTGSPLAPENFDFVYSDIRKDVHLASISGGTDIVSCFVLGNPARPVFRGEIQGPGLGMAVEVRNEEGVPVTGEKGELVCARPFPSMPVGFWNDPHGEKYHEAYFDRFDNVWCHGDFAEWTGNGGIIIHGRSDATLNPGGVRIGTAEIYNQVEQLEEVAEALCVGQEWEGDVRIVLFVRLTEGNELDEDLVKRIKSKIRNGASPRHVPAVVVAVPDIPRTKSGKITELAVREIIHGRPVKNREALANAEALEHYRDLPQLR